MDDKSGKVRNLGDTKKNEQYKIKRFVLPKSDPWIVFIDGVNYPVKSQIGRLLLLLAKKAKKAPK